MSMKVTFEASSAHNLFKQLADFIEVGSGEGSPSPVAVPTAAIAAEAAANIATPADLPAPTPAVRKLLTDAGVPATEWPSVARTGVNGKMTQGDVKAYLKSKVLSDKDSVEPVYTSASQRAAITGHSDVGEEESELSDSVLNQPDVVAAATEMAADIVGVPAKPVQEVVYTDADVRTALQAVYDYAERKEAKSGRQVCFDILSRFGAQRLSEVKEEQYTAFVLATKEYTSGGQDPQTSNG